ncbi:MAG: hypothetical protein AAFU61_17645, partial [Pseudomonadota bacterium]
MHPPGQYRCQRLAGDRAQHARKGRAGIASRGGRGEARAGHLDRVRGRVKNHMGLAGPGSEGTIVTFNP